MLSLSGLILARENTVIKVALRGMHPSVAATG
jgi:hypothetical protein